MVRWPARRSGSANPPGFLQSRTYQLWLDPSRDFVITRFLSLGKLWHQQIDVEYQRNQVCGWVPARWTFTQTDSKGTTTAYWESVVNEVEIGIPIEPSRFEIVFPPGTKVYGFGKTYVVPQSGLLGISSALLGFWPALVLIAVSLAAAGLFLWRRRVSHRPAAS